MLLSYQVIFPVFVNLKHAILHVVIHVVNLVHPLNAVDHHLPQPPRLARDHPLQIGNHLKVLRKYHLGKFQSCAFLT